MSNDLEQTSNKRSFKQLKLNTDNEENLEKLTEQKKLVFLKKLKGNSLKYKRYLGAPIKYAGGKSLAVGHIIEHLPNSIEKVVSPFLGGGSVEMAIATELNIPVIAYDVFDILVNFWEEFLNHKSRLVQNLNILVPTKDLYEKIKNDLKKHWKKEITLSNEELAWKYYFNHNLSYGPGFLGWMSSNYLDIKKYQNMIQNLSNKPNKNIKVYSKDFQNSIPNHNEDFMYIDPPYFLGGTSKLFKGIYPMRNIPVHHNNFNHIKLAELLKKHKGGFILSYNDCLEIRNLYKDFKIIKLEWQYTMGQGEKRIGKNRKEKDLNHIKKCSEILIIGERQKHEY